MTDLPLDAMHRWWATTAGPALAGRSPAHRRLAALHEQPRGVGATEWTHALLPALTELFTWAYPYAEAHATIIGIAREYAVANGYDADRAREEGQAYARMNTDAGLRVTAAANAQALASALANAYAADDAEAFARAYPEIVVRTVLLAVPQAREALLAGLRAQGVTP